MQPVPSIKTNLYVFHNTLDQWSSRT